MSTTVDLADLNVWLALACPETSHHRQGLRYWERQAAEQVLFCTVTALRLVRLACQPKLMGAAVRIEAEASALLDAFCMQSGVSIALAEPHGWDVFHKPTVIEQPIREESLLTRALESTNQWYAITKITGIKLCEVLRRQHSFDAINLISTNLYGPEDNDHPSNSHVLPARIRRFDEAAQANAASLTRWVSGSPKKQAGCEPAGGAGLENAHPTGGGADQQGGGVCGAREQEVTRGMEDAFCCEKGLADGALIAGKRRPTNGDQRACGDGLPIVLDAGFPQHILTGLRQLNRVHGRRILSIAEVEAKVTCDQDRNTPGRLINNKAAAIFFTRSMNAPFDFHISAATKITRLHEVPNKPASTGVLGARTRGRMTDQKSGIHLGSMCDGDWKHSDSKRQPDEPRLRRYHRVKNCTGEMTKIEA